MIRLIKRAAINEQAQRYRTMKYKLKKIVLPRVLLSS